VAGIDWVRKGAGWDCKLVWFEEGERRRKYLRHLGQKRWREIQAEYQGNELAIYISNWITEQKIRKGIELKS
jgi:hypothetical protein